jgi:predicted DNA-binding protein (MmcQ/YjbR family)
MPDPVLAKLRKLLLALPGTSEKKSWGHPNFHTSARTYCAYHETRDGVPCIWLRLDPFAAELLRDDPRLIRTTHGSAQGWIGVRAQGRIAWAFVEELARDAHALAAPAPKRAKRVSSAKRAAPTRH